MKKVKIVFWLLILGFMGLLFYQNQAYFLAKTSLSIDLWLEQYLIPATPNGIYFLACFLIGLLMAYFYNLPERYRSGKAVKHLAAEIASLKAQAAPPSRPAAPPEPVSPSEPPAAAIAPAEDSGPLSLAADEPEKTNQPQSS